MVFSSITFLFIFLPLTLYAYFILPDKFKNYVLLIASLIFYWFAEANFVFVLIVSSFLNYLFSTYITSTNNKKTKKIILICSILMNIGLLFVYKYLNFSLDIFNYAFSTNIIIKKIALPIGISFFTFQAMSYVIDVYRNPKLVEKNYFNVLLYICFFPQLISGPIVRFETVCKQIKERKHSFELFNNGTKRFMCGFIKKVLIANNISTVATSIFNMNPESTTIPLLWLGSICFSLQIYFDFSGYSDMAIGLGKLFGFTFEENFNYPYKSTSITDFWHRWHISLSRWFRDYVYIPLGGSRKGTKRTIINLLIVWLLTGIWHGANFTFILWGITYFILLIFEKYLIKPEKRSFCIKKILWPIFTLIFVNFLWVLFNSNNIFHALKFCLGMLGIYNNRFVIDAMFIGYIRDNLFFIITAILLALSVGKNIMEYKFKNNIFNILKSYVVNISIMIGFMWSISYLILGSHNPFIYFNF